MFSRPAWSRSSEPAVMNPPPCSINITCTKDTGRREAGQETGRVKCRPRKDESRKTGKLLWPCAICLLTCRFTYVYKNRFPRCTEQQGLCTKALIKHSRDQSTEIPHTFLRVRPNWLICTARIRTYPHLAGKAPTSVVVEKLIIILIIMT